MTKQCLFWKTVTCKDIRNMDYESNLPKIIAQAYRGKLLAEILKMPPKEPISFVRAVQLVSDIRLEGIRTHDLGKSRWSCYNFVNFISEAGFHIELSGDEFVFHLVSASI